MGIYDISQTIREGIAVWPGDQKFRIRWTMQLSEGDACNVSAVTMSCHTGTHVDAPYHFDDSGKDVGGISIACFLGPARVVSLTVDSAVTAEDLAKLNWAGVERVIFKTRASSVPEDQFDRKYVYLREDGAEFLGRQGLLLVGTDAPSVDAFESRTLSSHKALLKNGVAILEGARLARVPPGDYELICLPLRLAGLDASPVRALLRG